METDMKREKRTVWINVWKGNLCDRSQRLTPAT